MIVRYLFTLSLLFLKANSQFPNEISYDAIEPECQEQLRRIIANNNTVLIQMVDSWAKLPAGIFVGNIVDLGNFDQCVDIDYYPDETSMRIMGKYCMNAITTNITGVPVSRAICIPDKCSPSMFHTPFTPTSDALCQTKITYAYWDAGDYSVLGVLCFIAFLMVISTIYDVVLQSKELEPPHPSLLSFSVYTNGKKILATTNNPDQLPCLNGIRFISMLWVIAGHRFSAVASLPLINLFSAAEWRTSTYSAYIQGARVAVDTFFFLSAFLISYSFFRSKKPMTIKQIPIFYLHRILRITPALAAMYLVQVTLSRRISTGPYWAYYDITRETCLNQWWSFFLYVQNYVHYEKMCMLPTWYLSADMQMFIVAPFVILPLGALRKKNKKLAYIFATVVVAASMFIPMIVDFFRENTNEYETHTRLSVYVIGILFGMLVIDIRNKKNTISIPLNLALWVVSLAAMMLSIWHTFDVENKKTDFLKVNMHNTFSRPLWTVALCFVVYSCITGRGGIVNWFLSRPIYQILGRLSYSMYLLHTCVILFNFAYSRTSFYFSDYTAIYAFCGDVVFTTIAAVIWVLFFESPMIGIEKLIFGTNDKRAPRQDKKSDIAAVA